MATQIQPSIDTELARQMSEFYADPLGFVIFAYPWGLPGDLRHFDGPDQWQVDFLGAVGEQVRLRQFNGRDPVQPIRFARSSGHGIGKSTLAAWIVHWIMSTRSSAQGTVTANTFLQLKTKTWGQVAKWVNMSINSHWFVMTSEMMYHVDHPKTWFVQTATCREENSEAFAGQHAVSSTSFYIFDESSAVPDKIFEVAEGGLTDGEPMMFLFGNATRSTGKFQRVTFGTERNRWDHASIDSRTCLLPNKEQIQEWEDDYGEDSDFFRVRVRGLPPRASDLQFIGTDLVSAAQMRRPISLEDDPLVVGIDIARGGDDNNVICFRKGFDARTIKPIKLTGAETRNSTLLVAKIVDTIQQMKPDAVFADGTGVGGPIVDRLNQLGYAVEEIQFGWAAPDSTHFANMRAWMWNEMRKWLKNGAIEQSADLEIDLVGPGYTHDKRDRVLLESKESMKKRGLASPDYGDALALTFAMSVDLKPLEIEIEEKPEFRYTNGPYRGWMK
jgi:hypothetical protein